MLDCRAQRDPELVAVLATPFPLFYSSGGSAAEDHPPFVRAASAIRRWGHERVVIQDDVNVLGLGGFGPGQTLRPVLLPRGANGRRRFDAAIGNKRRKLDLEAATVLPDGRLLALGSGSLSERERLVLFEPGGGVHVREANELYALLRSHEAFAGSELNLEGAVATGEALLLFQRGNGIASDTVAVTSAVAELPLHSFLTWLDHSGPVPALTRIVRVDLGEESGVRLGFTDATLQADGSLAFLACAEDSPNAIDDGRVLCCRFGVFDMQTARLTDIVDAEGERCSLKLEGIEAHPEDSGLFDVVADIDDPDRPAVGATLRVTRRG